MIRQRITSKDVNEFIAKYWLLFCTVIVALTFGLIEKNFMKPTNLLNILSSACLTGITGIGITCIFAAGEIDFCCGMELSLGAVGMYICFQFLGIKSYYLALMVTLLLLVILGCINALLHVKIGIPAFIATMGTNYLIRGILRSITNGTTIFGARRWPSEFTFLGQGYLFGVIPMPMVVLIVIGVGMLLYTECTKSGRYTYATGVNPAACRFLGINSNWQKFKGFILCSVLCGIAGIVQGSMINGCSAELGDVTLLNSLTVLMLGATFIKKGVFNVPGTILAAILITVLTNGFTMVGVPAFVKDLVQGTILIIAVSVVAILRKRAATGK